MIKTDLSGFEGLIGGQPDLAHAAGAYDKLMAGAYAGYDGWLRPGRAYDGALDRRLKDTAAEIRESSDVLVVVGVGGSGLGPRAVLDALCSPDYNLKKKASPNIYFAGDSLSAPELADVVSLLEDRDFSVNVVSKSGSTLETAAAFRVFYSLLRERYGDGGARARVIVTTDPEKGALRAFAEENGLRSLPIPPDVGGRFSALTPVGLLTAAVAGEDPCRLIAGAEEQLASGREEALRYAAARQRLYAEGKSIELCAFFEPRMRSLCEWWKQLFGESECKNGRGIFPAGAIYTTDLHSLGQCVQEGERNLFETFVRVTPGERLALPAWGYPGDGLDPLAGRELSMLGGAAVEAVKRAHMAGGVPVIGVDAGALTPESLGALLMFFETACAVSAMMQGVHPFDQPGVEAYKRNLRGALGL